MICYSPPANSDMEMSSMKNKGNNSSSSATCTYYDRNHEEDWCKVVTTQPDGSTVAQHAPREPRNYMGLAVVTLVCFNIPFGIIAVILSIKANRDFLKGDRAQARVKGKLSMVSSVLGIVCTMTAVFLVIFWPAIHPTTAGTASADGVADGVKGGGN